MNREQCLLTDSNTSTLGAHKSLTDQPAARDTSCQWWHYVRHTQVTTVRTLQ
jgi:hypothetical protein